MSRHGEEAAVTDSGGEVSMSIDETNRIRISLGMKPLNMGPSTTGPKIRDADAERASMRRTAEAEDLRGKIASQREKRQMEAKIKAIRPLGAAGDEDEEDDIASWAEKSKDKMAARKAEEEQEQRRKKAAEEGRRVNAMDSDDDDDTGGPEAHAQDGASGYSASELAGLRVKHSLTELAAGEGMILTLADKCLLDEKGNLIEGEDADDELENALVGEERKRKKARDAAAVGKKGKPLWEEDGKVRTMLDKYDEEEEERGVALGEGGVLEAARLAAQEAMRKKMAHGGGINAIIDSVAPKADPLLIKAGPASDYYTAAEAEALSMPLKKKKKKAGRQLRTKEGDGADDGSTFDLVAALEAEAQAKGDTGDSHLGSRTERMSIKERQAEVSVVEQADKRARFEAALGKANWASQALRQQPAAAASAHEEDDELAASLQKARRQAAASAAAAAATAAAAAAVAAKAKAEQEAGPSSSDAVLTDAQTGRPVVSDSASWAVDAVKRAAARDSATAAASSSADPSGVMLFNDASEFVRTIAVKQETAASVSAAAAAAAGASGGATSGRASVKERGVDMYNDDAAEGAEDGDGASAMDIEENGSGAEASAAHPGRWGSWVSAEEAEQSGTAVVKQRNLRKKETDKEAAEREGVAASGSEDVGITGERSIGRGLASVLGLLHDKGVLKQKLEWSGRTNDKKANMVLGLDDVYTGGSHEEHIARAVEAALTTRDQYGRVLTPKERFRELCYKFHGIQPSKNKIDKRIRQDTEEIIVKKAATSERDGEELERMREMQKNSGSAYIVLSGKGAPTRAAGAAPLKRPKNGMDSEGRSTVPPPVPRAKKAGGAGLDGGMTPLEGDRKVEALLGLRKPPPPSNNAGVLSMLPPPPRPPAGQR